ncbi:MAG: TetR/AcrR family transcriptional regulator [Patulibacter minatonensis]
MPTQVQRTASARRRLIAATRDLVAAQGVGNTSVAAIGERAGMSRGAVNFHFGSKDDLLVAVSQEVTTDWAEKVFGEGTPTLDDVDELVETLLGVWLGELNESPDRVRIVVMLLFEALGPSPHLHEHFVVLRRRVRDQIVAYLTERQAKNEVSKDVDPDGFATLFLGVLLGVAVTHLADPESSALDGSIQEARATLLARLQPTG